MITAEVLIGYDDHMSKYVITESTIEKVLRAPDCATINDLIVSEGVVSDDTPPELADVFFDMVSADESAFADFQEAMFELYNDLEQEEANAQLRLMCGGNPE